jgi:3'-phosphoadenosine 5'-phosphosulfate sulfotransferase (PAPS reductase)/FAD synthetase
MKDKDSFLLYARTNLFRRRVEGAKAVIYEALKACPSWHIALSGGKDSTCVLALVRAIAPDIPAVCSVSQWMLPETREYLSRVENLELVASGSDHGTGWYFNWESAEDVPAGIRWIGDRGHVQKNYGREVGGVFLGLREEESGRRRAHLRKMGRLFFSQKDQTWHCSPIARWTVMDVWTFIVSNELDYNRAYDRLEEIGIPLEQQRIGPLAVERVLGYGQLAILKRGWPDLFNQFAARFPEARSYV